MSFRAEIAGLTVDPGARRLGEIADQQQAQLDRLQSMVEACCGADLRPAAPTPPAPPTPVTPPTDPTG